MKKRFIAGARCPACHAIDSLALWQANEDEPVQAQCALRPSNDAIGTGGGVWPDHWPF
ncbi:YheV family putative metal-binding protein [Edwardsiella anguillarum]|nr:YheV family putative metal-binding protein [Edwardsiella anguillarum]